MKNKPRVQIVYRNYKPLHQTYESFRLQPPEDVEMLIPDTKKNLRRFYPIYKKYGDNWLVRKLLSIVQGFLFKPKSTGDKQEADVYHYLQMLPSKIPEKPFIVDLEHAAALSNFVKPDAKQIESIHGILTQNNCKKIIPLSNASQNSIKNLLGKAYKQIEPKIEIVYPAMPCYYNIFADKKDYSVIDKSDQSFKLLFVGNEVIRKGLLEVLEAFTQINNPTMKLYVVSDAPNDIKSKYTAENIIYLEPKFPKEQFIKQIWLHMDVFVMPTHSDTFGMVYLDALASGVPVIATRQFAVKEIVQENINGLFVKSDKLYLEQTKILDRQSLADFEDSLKIPEEVLVRDLVTKINLLHSDRKLLQDLKSNSTKEFQINGKFSIETRNAKLNKIYLEAIKS